MSKTLLSLLGLLAFAILGYFCIYSHHRHEIQADIQGRTIAALRDACPAARVTTDGRDVTLTGVVATDEVKRRCEKLATGIWGNNAVANKLTVEQIKVDTPVQAAAKSCQTQFNELLKGETILFVTGSALVDPASHELLDKLAEEAKECPEAKVTIAGHTDHQGAAASNQKLSEQRASSVVAYLKQKGIAASRLTAVGYGFDKPVASNSTPEGMQKNRRIEFNVEGI